VAHGPSIVSAQHQSTFSHTEEKQQREEGAQVKKEKETQRRENANKQKK
jgi:hypothetical protein